MKNRWQTEPVRLTAAIQGLGTALINLWAFAAHWSADLTALANATWISMLVVAFSIHVRSNVSPTGNVSPVAPALTADVGAVGR